MELSTKKCFRCGVDKALDQFGTDNRSKDGVRGTCKDCRNPTTPIIMKELTERDKFIEKAKSIPKLLESDIPDIKHARNVFEECVSYFEKSGYPPTNKFRVCPFDMVDLGSSIANSNFIKSKLGILLSSKGVDPIKISIETNRDSDYERTHIIHVVLPEEIKLESEEINEFILSLSGQKPKEKMVNLTTILFDDINVLSFLGEFIIITRKFLIDYGYKANNLPINCQTNNTAKVRIFWSKEYLIREKDISILNQMLVDHVMEKI
jgi:hypothetical protein